MKGTVDLEPVDGKIFRRLRLEYPVRNRPPQFQPQALSCRSVSIAFSESFIKHRLSDSSFQVQVPARFSSRIRATSPGKPGLDELETDTFTAIRAMASPASSQVRACRHAVRNTHSPTDRSDPRPPPRSDELRRRNLPEVALSQRSRLPCRRLAAQQIQLRL